MSENMNKKLTYTFQEACEVAQVSAPTLRALMRTPGFPALRVGTAGAGKGKKIVIPIEAYRRFLEEQANNDIDRT